MSQAACQMTCVHVRGPARNSHFAVVIVSSSGARVSGLGARNRCISWSS